MSTRPRAALAVEREYQPDPARCVAAIVKLLTYRPPAATDSAGSVRPLGAGDRLQTHDDRVSACQQDDAVAEEDEHRELLTTHDA